MINNRDWNVEAFIFTEIENILTAPELTKLREIAGGASFVDGRISNPHNTTKKNLQIDHTSKPYQESTQILSQALMRSEEFRNFAFMKRMARRFCADMSRAWNMASTRMRPIS